MLGRLCEEGFRLFEKLKNVVLLTGHYGCGKTNLAVNLALYFKHRGEEVKVVDLDIINPYFRAADFEVRLKKKGIPVIAPRFANSLLDIPALPSEMTAVFSSEGRIVVDVGGDDAGAVVLGRYHSDILKAGGADVLYLFSIFRPESRSLTELGNHIKSIEEVSRQKVTFLVNSSNLGADTEYSDINKSLDFARELSEFAKIPLISTVVLDHLSAEVENSFAVKRFVRLPWEAEEYWID